MPKRIRHPVDITETSYFKAAHGSKRIVDLIEEQLRQEAGALERYDAIGCTSFGINEGTNFLYVYPQRREQTVRCYPKGKFSPVPLLPSGMPALQFKLRKGWEDYQYCVDLTDELQVEPFSNFVKENSVILSRPLGLSYPSDDNFPQEVPENDLWEGHSTRVTVNRYERKSDARKECLRIQGLTCSACDMSFASLYGEQYKNCIQVHHLTPISQMGGKYKVDPAQHLVPLCPNCHAVVHKTDPPLTIAELRVILQSRAVGTR